MRHLWQVRWTDGREQVVEATHLYHHDPSLLSFGGDFRQQGSYQLVVSGEGIVWSAKDDLIASIERIEAVVDRLEGDET